MLRLFAALILAIALAPSARADTSVIISGGGFSFFSGSEGLHRFHHERRHWRRFHDGGGFGSAAARRARPFWNSASSPRS